MKLFAPLRSPKILARVVLFLCAVALSLRFVVSTVSDTIVSPSVAQEFDRVARWTGKSVCASDAGPGRTASELTYAVYTNAGAIVASGGAHVMAPLDEARRLELAKKALVRTPTGAAVRCADGLRYAVFEAPTRRVLPEALFSALALTFGVIAVAGLAFSRGLVRPLTALVETAGKLGRGDLTARADAARGDEFGDLARAFNQMAERLEAAVRAEREMLGNVSHELRTPLSRVRFVLEWAREDPERAQPLLADVERDLVEINDIIDSVLDSLRFDVGATSLGATGFRPIKSRHALAPLARQSVATAAAAHPTRTLRFDERHAGAEVLVDARLLRRVLSNVIENALRYSDEVVDVAIDASADGAVLVSVRDRGIGLSDADQQELFRPFFRADRSRSRSTGGVGLGLVIVKRIVEAHDGRVSITSTLGVGTEVVITLPVAEAPVEIT